MRCSGFLFFTTAVKAYTYVGMAPSSFYRTIYRLATICSLVALTSGFGVNDLDKGANDYGFHAPSQEKATRGPDVSSGSASGEPSTVVTIPTCSADDEFLSSDGLELTCRKIPPCTCFVEVPSNPTGSPAPPDRSVPLPPTGCPVFQPPLRGAFICYLNSTINLMFCSVYCDHRFEFLATPNNPYFCGPSTNFQWVDATRRIYTALPECTAHRLTVGTIHSIMNYLPSPCYGLTDHTILAIMNEFREMLRKLGYSSVAENVFLQCPGFEGTERFYSDVMLRATH